MMHVERILVPADGSAESEAAFACLFAGQPLFSITIFYYFFLSLIKNQTIKITFAHNLIKM